MEMFKASTLMLNKSHYDFRGMPGQKYLIWQTPWEHEWEMLANLWNRLPGWRCKQSPTQHSTLLTEVPALLRLLHIHSANQSCSQVIPGAKGQQTGRQQEPETQTALLGRDALPRMSSVTPSEAWSRQNRSRCSTLIVYLKCAKEKCSIKFAEIWTEIQT